MQGVRRFSFMNYCRIAIMILLVGSLGGCTNAGPFVTNISKTGDSDLLVEKCELKHDAFMGVVSTENCTNYTIKMKP
jgi:type IV secretion system protein VirB7